MLKLAQLTLELKSGGKQDPPFITLVLHVRINWPAVK